MGLHRLESNGREWSGRWQVVNRNGSINGRMCVNGEMVPGSSGGVIGVIIHRFTHVVTPGYGVIGNANGGGPQWYQQNTGMSMGNGRCGM